MKDFNSEVFAIVNADNTKILTEIGWVGLFLSQEAMTPEKVSEKLYGGLSLNGWDWRFEQRSDGSDYVQYYKSFERASEVLLEVSTRENSPVTELMSIVTVKVATVTTMFDIKAIAERKQKIASFDEFEKDAAQKLGCEPDVIKQHRNLDLSGYGYPAFQRSYEAWVNFNACLIQE